MSEAASWIAAAATMVGAGASAWAARSAARAARGANESASAAVELAGIERQRRADEVTRRDEARTEANRAHVTLALGIAPGEGLAVRHLIATNHGPADALALSIVSASMIYSQGTAPVSVNDRPPAPYPRLMAFAEPARLAEVRPQNEGDVFVVFRWTDGNGEHEEERTVTYRARR